MRVVFGFLAFGAEIKVFHDCTFVSWANDRADVASIASYVVMYRLAILG